MPFLRHTVAASGISRNTDFGYMRILGIVMKLGTLEGSVPFGIWYRSKQARS